MTSTGIDRGTPKSAIRRRALSRRRELGASRRDALSTEIQRHFLGSPMFLASRVLGCYLASPDEVDTSLIIERAWRAGKTLCVPVIGLRRDMVFVRLERDSRLLKNHFGLWEPADGIVVPPRELDVVVTPLAAFDRARNRIGMGGGFFDRHFAFLKRRDVWLRPKLAGLAFSCQRVETMLTDTWDVPLYRVIDEDGIH